MSNISLSRGIDKKQISLTKKKDEGLQLPISELIKLTGLFVKQKDSEGNVIVDYTNDLVYYLMMERLATLLISEAELPKLKLQCLGKINTLQSVFQCS